jgi:predicted transposase/invertase (TIGR01784 family)
MRPLISFDWAIKRLLRQKANYGILEGFLAELLRQDITIRNIPESEANVDDLYDKTNKVDILCENEQGELLLIELQYYSEFDYFHRMLFGTSKLITDYLKVGEPYSLVKKVYSINIVYFELGQGTDYVYHGKNEFRGIHTNDILQVNQSQKETFRKEQVHQIYPEYYIIKVNNFDNVAKDSLDEWIYYFKNNTLPDRFNAKGLSKVAEQLKIDNMSTQEKVNYEAHLKNLSISQNMLETAKLEGKLEGQLDTAHNLMVKGFANEEIADLTKLPLSMIMKLRNELN